MRNDLLQNLSERFLEYQYLRQEGAYHAALKRMVEIYHCLPQLDKAARRKWTEQIQRETLPDEFIVALKVGIEEDAERIRKILAYGTIWNADEVLLVLTMRIEIDLALSFLNEYCSQKVTVTTSDIDEQIVDISKTKENRHAFEVATNLMNKNWGLPIQSKWLSRDFSDTS